VLGTERSKIGGKDSVAAEERFDTHSGGNVRGAE